MIRLHTCPKGYTTDLDKAVPPEDTVRRVKAALQGNGTTILAETRRVDTGRLDIPVYMSVCGEAAKRIMPTRKQMGKGASPAQAEASALMELVERYSFFSCWEKHQKLNHACYTDALAGMEGLPEALPVEFILQSVNESMPKEKALRILDLVHWSFYPATDLSSEKEYAIPLDWFKTLNEFNGTSAGNTQEESILQGACELIERHVCALIDREKRETPTISPASLDDPVLLKLYDKFLDNGLRVLMKDFSMGMPAPTVAAVVYDPHTFPTLSEIVFTAGTAATPEKAAIRALTEVAQLGGDFQTGSIYEASGLPKYARLKDIAWLQQGPEVSLQSLPRLSADNSSDISTELMNLAQGLRKQGFALLSADITDSDLGLPAHYNIVPGFAFRERDLHASLGLFVGRRLVEEEPIPEVEAGLDVLEELYPNGHFVPFFRGMLALRLENPEQARMMFEIAEQVQPDDENKSMAAFYAAYSLTLMERWAEAEPGLDRALEFCNEHKEYFNLRGVVKFKQQRYKEASADFSAALELDRGSVMDLANLGMCYLRMGEKAKAKEHLISALQMDPSLKFVAEALDEI